MFTTEQAFIQNKKEKKVHWNENCQVRTYGYNYGNDVETLPCETWYTANDFASFKKDRRVTVVLAKELNSDEIESLSYTTCWGMEGFIHAPTIHKKKRRRNAIGRVLQEQETQLQEGIKAPEMLARIYADDCEAAKTEAYQRAQQYHTELRNAELHEQRTSKCNNYNRRKGPFDRIVLFNTLGISMVKVGKKMQKRQSFINTI